MNPGEKKRDVRGRVSIISSLYKLTIIRTRLRKRQRTGTTRYQNILRDVGRILQCFHRPVHRRGDVIVGRC